MLKPYLPLLALVSSLGCATTSPAPDDVFADVPSTPGAPAQATLATPPPRKFDAAAWVAEQHVAGECEETAYAMRKQAPNRAWLALRACVELGHYLRGAKFVQIGLLTSHWADEITARPDGPRVVARVIANRGGDVDGDLLRFQDARVPIFLLSAAIAQPALYRGRLVVIHAKVSGMKADDDGAATLRLNEVAFRSVNGGNGGELNYNYWTRSGSVFSNYGNIADNNNVTYATGREGLGKIPQADPFIQPDREFVFLAKFEGNRNDDSGHTIAILTVLSYDPATAYMVE